MSKKYASKYAAMTDQDFDSILEKILDGYSGAHLLAIPGLYEVVAEHFNNEVLEKWEEEHPAPDDDE